MNNYNFYSIPREIGKLDSSHSTHPKVQFWRQGNVVDYFMYLMRRGDLPPGDNPQFGTPMPRTTLKIMRFVLANLIFRSFVLSTVAKSAGQHAAIYPPQ